MATIIPHTTRATGTVLTATIYNNDHQSHVTNATELNIELAATAAKFPSTTIDNQIPRFDGVLGDLKQSGVSIDDNNRLWIESNVSGSIGPAKDKGILLTADLMTTTDNHTPGVLFGSTDDHFSTQNPKILAGIYGVAIENYVGDADAGMGLAFYTSVVDGGASPGLLQGLLIRDGLAIAGDGQASAMGGASTTVAVFGSRAIAGEIHLRPNGGFTLGVGTEQATIQSNGNMIIGGSLTQNSDESLKTDIKPIVNAVAIIKAIPAVRYSRLNGGQRKIGFVYQDVQPILPEVGTWREGLGSLSYADMVAIPWAAVAELAARVEALEARP